MAIAIAVAIAEARSTNSIPPKASEMPLATEVMPNAIPIVVPNMPFARSRRSSGTMSATSVGIAML